MEHSIFVKPPKTSKLRKIQRVRVKSNHVLFLLMVTFLLLYVRDHARLIEVEIIIFTYVDDDDCDAYLIKVEEALEAYEEEETPENHALVMEGRRRRLEELCKKFDIETRIEHSSLFHRWQHLNI